MSSTLSNTRQLTSERTTAQSNVWQHLCVGTSMTCVKPWSLSSTRSLWESANCVRNSGMSLTKQLIGDFVLSAEKGFVQAHNQYGQVPAGDLDSLKRLKEEAFESCTITKSVPKNRAIPPPRTCQGNDRSTCNTTTHPTYKTNNYRHLNKITQTR